MILTDLWCTNFRCHKKLHVKFKTGVTGIVGDNGTGKSSIIEALQFLFTGELFKGKKEEAITLDADSGYVAGAFILNDKRGRIERHLDSSKVILKYDDVEYKKATEVKELWDKLLQLNPEIIKRVIIARQGDIPQLFSGDPAVREKVFQKIFLVPPTEKLRNMIHKDYLKQAPPVVPEEDLLQLNNTREFLETELAQLEEKIDSLTLLTDEEQQAHHQRVDFIKKCIDDAHKGDMLCEALKAALANLREVDNEVNEINEKLKLDIGKYRRMNTMLLQHKGLYAQKLKLESELEKLEYPFAEQDYLDVKDLLREEYVRQNERAGTKHALTTEIAKLQKEIDQLSTLKDEAHCPTCKQMIVSVGTHIELLMGQLKDSKSEFAAYSDEFAKGAESVANMRKLIESYETVLRQDEGIRNSLNQLKTVTFDEEMLSQTTAVIERYTELEREKLALELKHARATASVTDIRREHNALSTYDGTNPQEELETILTAMNQHVENYRVYQQLNVDWRVKQVEVKNIKERIKNAEVNHEKNKLRNDYVATLDKAYTILHTSQFPRKLIMSYADVVTDYLQENLELFDIPYTARVADNFKIEMLDDQDRILPHVSGGQEIMVGISLHLALHDLFSQSFPLMVIDEGTTHLDSPNRKAYFEMIKGLKSKSKLKQILIIDHDPQLSEVVDHVIQLKKT